MSVLYRIFSYMTTYYADDFIKSGYFQRFTRALRLIALEILEYPKYKYSNSRSWDCEMSLGKMKGRRIYVALSSVFVLI